MDGTPLSSPTPFTQPTTEEDRLDWLRLIRSRRVGPGTFHRLLAEHGNAGAALAALPGIARDAGLNDYAPFSRDAAQRELEAGRRIGARLLLLGTPEYPPALAAITDPPPVLWAMGRASDLSGRPAVAMVGARNASSLGLRMARRLGEGIGNHGYVVVSGLARGIDTAAHGAALGTGTIAVMAGGVDVIYPPENAALAAAIADQGLRVSEIAPGVQPQARHFPRRNRLIAGLALACCVVEAADGSGSLITAQDALDMGRDVMAVPGHPLDARAAGCNRLLREGARLIRNTEDMLDALSGTVSTATQAGSAPRSTPGSDGTTGGAPHRAARPTANRGDTSPQPRPVAGNRGAAPQSGNAAGSGTPHPSPVAARRPDTLTLHRLILDHLGTAPVAEDQLIRDLCVPVEAAAPALLFLELEGRIRRQPGGMLALA